MRRTPITIVDPLRSIGLSNGGRKIPGIGGLRSKKVPLEKTPLQNNCISQDVDEQSDDATLEEIALQENCISQLPLIIGLMSILSGFTLQEDIDRFGRELNNKGRQILSTRPVDAVNQKSNQNHAKTHSRFKTSAPRAGPLYHQLIRSRLLCGVDSAAWAFYLFLVTVGDERGLSYYSESSICSHLNLSGEDLRKARGQLLERRLIAWKAPLYQILCIQGPQRADDFPGSESATVPAQPERKTLIDEPPAMSLLSPTNIAVSSRI